MQTRYSFIVGLYLALLFSIAGAASAASVAAGNKSTLYVSDSGDLFGWGANPAGQLGDGSTTDRSSPVIPAETGPWARVATGLIAPPDADDASTHSLAIKQNGTLWAWGDNSRGQLGLGDTVDRSEPVRIGSASNWVAVDAGTSFSVALNTMGEIWVWGDNTHGQLGPGVAAAFRPVPVRLADKDGDASYNDTFIAVAAGADHVLALHRSSTSASLGAIFAWGKNNEGQLGLGTPVSDSPNPVQVGGSALWRVIEAGVDNSFAIDAYGKLYAWGFSAFGGLGIGSAQVTNIQRANVPTLTENSDYPGMTYRGVSAGTSHTLAVAANGAFAFGTGQNASDQIGIPTGEIFNTFRYIPLDVPAGAEVDAVAAGRAYSVAVFDDGSVVASGANDRGQLGIGTTNGSSSFTETSLGSVDLVVDSINLRSDPAAVAPGATFDFDVIVRNASTGTVEAGTGGDIRVALSPQTIFGAEGQIDFATPLTIPLTDEIGPGASVSVEVSATLPSVVPSGGYHVLVSLDDSDALEESDETNNTAASEAVEGLLDFRADLEVALVGSTIPASIEAGQTFSLEVDFLNSGTGSLPGGAGSGFDYRLILADTADPFADTVFDLSIDSSASEFPFTSPLAAGAPPERRTIQVTVPEDVALGDYFLGVLVDPGNEVAELEEVTNNSDFTSSAAFEVTGLSIREVLDLADPPVDNFGTPLVDEAVPAVLQSTGDGNWFGTVDTDAINTNALSSPLLQPGEFASLTFESDTPREVTFRWRADTSSSQNRLFFGANRVPLQPENNAAPVTLSGVRPWSEVSFVVPGSTPVGFFYEQGIEGTEDRVYVDDLRVSPPLDKPDYVIDAIQFEAGEYMLRRDRLTLTVSGINRGADFELPEDFKVSVWLSRDAEAGDADDVLLGDLSALQILPNGSEFVYRASFDLPDSLVDADYFVLARVDSGGDVDEFNEAPTAFDATDNNFALSEDAGVRITRAADLRVTRFVGQGELPIFVGGPADHPEFETDLGQGEQSVFATFFVEPLEGDTSELQIRFDVVNEGLAPVAAQDYSIRIFAATSRDIPPEDATTLFEFEESSGLAIGGGKGFEITTDIPETLEPGRFYYLGVEVDSLNEVPESDEVDNVTRSEENNVFVGEVPLETALNDSLPDPALRLWNDGFPGSIEGSASASPWFGQSDTVQLDSAQAAAAQSGPVPIEGRSEMTTVVEVSGGPRLISFFWKVSSQLDFDVGQLDTLEFAIREGSSGPFETIAGPIAGEVDWTKVEYTIEEEGSYTLRWKYEESGDGLRAGADAGWVDNFSAASPDFAPLDPASRTNPAEPASSSSPGLQLSTNELVGNTSDGILVPGDEITVAFDLQNLGDGFYDSIATQIRLTRTTGSAANLDWTASGARDVILLEDERLAIADGSGSGGFSRSFTIPDSLGEAGAFFVGVWVDFKGSLAESDEGNNLQFAAGSPLELEPLFTFDEALETDSAPWTGDNRDWVPDGQGRWFPVGENGSTVDLETFDGTDAIRSPEELGIGESAVLERIVEGPALMTFYWKADTVPEQNFLELQINGVSQSREFGPGAGEALRISGDVPWMEETVLIPAGEQIVSFAYVKNSNENPTDVVRVDAISRAPVNQQDLAIVRSGVTFNPSPDPDSGVQRYALERDAFPLAVTVVNRGGLPGSGFDYSDLDIEVRFSEDQQLGPDDFIVGNLAVSEVLESGQRLVFGGSIDLPLDLPAQRYHLLLNVDSLDPDFDELVANNFYASPEQSIEILHLPRLDTDLDGEGVVTEKVYYPKESIRLDWKLLNIGLGDIGGDGSTGYDQTIQLWAFPPNTTEFTIDNADLVRDLHVENERAFLPGALNRDSLSEATVRYQTELTLPRAGILLNDLGEIQEESEDEDADVVAALEKLWEYTFYFVIVREFGADFPQSSNLAIRHFPSERFKIAAFPVDDVANDTFTGETLVDYETWRTFNEDLLTNALDLELPLPPALDPNPAQDTFGNGVEDLFYYALDLPLKSNTRYTGPGGAFNRFGTVFVDGEAYQRMTFRIVRGAQDLRYIVEASDSMMGLWEEILTIEPPYLDARGTFQTGYFGAQSLTGPEASALLNQASPNGGGYLPVTAIIDQNYTATVTVRDYKPLGVTPSRFMRLRIEYTGP